MIYLLMALTFVFSWVFPWWIVYFIGFVLGMREKRLLRTMTIHFVGVFVVWVLMAYYFDLRASGVISHRISQMLNLPSPYLTLVISGVVGGLAAALGGMSGYHFSKAYPKLAYRFFNQLRG